MSSDQITYVLVALIVAGLAILLILAGAFLARRSERLAGPASPAAASPAPPAAPLERAPERAAPAEATLAVPAPPVAAAPGATAPPSPTVPQPVAEPEQAMPAPPPGSVSEPPVEESGAVTAADLADAAARVHDPREEEVIEGFLSISPRRREVAAAEGPRPPTAVGPGPTLGVEPRVAAPRPPAREETAPSDPYVDDLTGLDSRAAWDRELAEENARYVRYRRPVSVVVGELDGLARFQDQFGDEAARRVLAAVGGAYRRAARRTDRVAHAGNGRFLVLMPETDEIQAINYVERVRAECERWLEAGAAALRLSLGWASPSAVGELDTALRTAEERMYAERRRAARAGSGDPGAPR